MYGFIIYFFQPKFDLPMNMQHALIGVLGDMRLPYSTSSSPNSSSSPCYTPSSGNEYGVDVWYVTIQSFYDIHTCQASTVNVLSSNHHYDFKYPWTSFRGDQYLWISQILLFFWDVISWVTGLLHYLVRWFITLLYVYGDVKSWIRLTHNIHEHWSPTNDDSTVYIYLWINVKCVYSQLLCSHKLLFPL